MRKLSAVAIAVSSFALAIGSASAASAAPSSQAGGASDVSVTASCLKVLDWYNSGTGRYVKVKNSCGHKACFSVTVAARSDPDFSIGANKTESFRYGGILWTEGSGIKEKNC
ncbi:hypothetical protein [Streptomyces sp. NPDC048481]|uniref:hypothetical protein n=1 Tax=Streptomyces sp. NPDC048481 TaxID=3365557 RepID=UPI0037209C1D